MMEEFVWLWCDCGDMLDEEGLGDWLEVYDRVLDGGVMVGVLVEEMVVSGDGMLVVEIGW